MHSLRLTSKKRGNGRNIIASVYCAFLLVRRKILRLYFGLPIYNIALFTCIKQGQRLNKVCCCTRLSLISYKNAKARTGVHIYSAATPRE